MVGKVRKDKDGKRITHYGLLENDDVRRWYENLSAKSGMTAKVYLRGLGFYCDKMKTDPTRILEDAVKVKPLQDQFHDFVQGMQKEGKAGAYIARYKKVLHSWTKYNNVEFRSITNIRNENINEKTQNERVPTVEEMRGILHHAGLRERVAISLMAFSGLRPRSMSNEDGTDCLRVRDIPELIIENGKVTFPKVSTDDKHIKPIQIVVKPSLNKGQKHGYFTFMGNTGITYLKEYLEYRIRDGETLELDSPILQYDRDVDRQHTFIPTFYIERQIRKTFRDAGIAMRPYILRAYFATGMDIAEQKGAIKHPWRQFFMGHIGDMEGRYSTNKKPLPETIEEMRSAYEKSFTFFDIETEERGIKEEDSIRIQRNTAIFIMETAFKMKLTDEQKEELSSLDIADLQKRLGEIFQEKRVQELNNGNKHKTISEKDLETYLNRGWELVQIYPKGDRAVVKLPSQPLFSRS
ncbi:MAG: site-specific integrase [Thermoplasmataceae archaeon]